MKLIVSFQFSILKAEGFLENRRIHIRRVRIAAETEIPQRIGDKDPFIIFDPFQHMRVMAKDQVRAFIDSQMAQLDLSLRRIIDSFRTRMHTDNDQVHVLFLDFL